MKTISITVEENILARLDRLADRALKDRKNRSSMIRYAMREYVSRMERQIEEEREREVFRRQRARLEKEAIALVREQATP
jgi:metal-responsive CopG/Arc/MetJ family transcriptional regulator